MSELRWVIGTVSVTRVLEQDVVVPINLVFPVSNRAVSNREGAAARADWLAPWALDAEQRVHMSIQAFGLEADGRRIVVDTCVGQRPLSKLYESMANDGSFLTALGDAGFAPEAVDRVVCTHLHFDHVGWNTRLVGGRWVPTFPNARYVLARREYEYWRDQDAEVREAHSAITLADAVEPLFDFEVVDLVEADHQLTPSVSLTPTPGHSPGHVSVRIRSAGAEAIITGDCVHSPLQLAEPHWGTVSDTDSEQSAATRRALIAEYVDRDVLVIGTHFPPPTAGHIISAADGSVRFRPLARLD